MKSGEDSVRIDTGVSGLNDILSGGLPPGQMYLLEGDPGTGKTTLAMQFILAGTRVGDRALYIALSESKSELEGSARSHGWNTEELPIAEFIPAEASLTPEQQYTVFHPSEVELAGTIHKLTQLIDELKPDRVVIDSLSELRLLAADTMRYRRQLLALKRFFAGRDTTVLLLDDRTAEGSDMQLQSIAHGVVRLEKVQRSYGVTRRHVEIIKLRGSAFREGRHDYTIQRGRMSIYPRLIASEHDASFDGARIVSGLPVLDGMFGGGLNRGSSTLVLGPSGAGKSTLAMVYAYAAAKRGERTIVYVFDEVLRTAQDQKGVATILVYTQHGLVGSMQTEVDVSYLSDTVVLLRYFEAEGEIRQLISVIKQRIGAHERTLREFRMSSKGVEIGETLRSYRGVLTGIPEFPDRRN